MSSFLFGDGTRRLIHEQFMLHSDTRRMSVTTPSNLKAAVADDHFMAPLSAGMLRGLGFKQVAEVNDTVALRKLLAS